MNTQSKTAKITRETARAKTALSAGASPESVGMSAYVQGWAGAYDQTSDAEIGKKSGWIARHTRGTRDRLAHDLALADLAVE